MFYPIVGPNDAFVQSRRSRRGSAVVYRRAPPVQIDLSQSLLILCIYVSRQEISMFPLTTLHQAGGLLIFERGHLIRQNEKPRSKGRGRLTAFHLVARAWSL